MSKSQTVNYEVDKTIRHTKEMPGMIKRLSVAVVVNQKRDASKGPAAKPVPLSEKEMAQVTELVREAVGYTKERGDTLNVTNALFNTAGSQDAPETPMWKDPSLIASAKGLLKYAIFGVIAFLLWTRLLKPLFANLATMAQNARAAAPAPVFDEGAGIQSSPERVNFDAKVKHARNLATNDPKLVASLIKEWVGGGEPR